MISLGVFTDPILGAPNYLASVSASEAKVIVGALLELVMGVALVGMALAIYPVLKKFSARMAIGYFGARIVEFVVCIVGVVSLLTLVTLSQELAGAGAPSASYFQATGKLLLAVRDNPRPRHSRRGVARAVGRSRVGEAVRSAARQAPPR